jgi:hypothetical protein
MAGFFQYDFPSEFRCDQFGIFKTDLLILIGHNTQHHQFSHQLADADPQLLGEVFHNDIGFNFHFFVQINRRHFFLLRGLFLTATLVFTLLCLLPAPGFLLGAVFLRRVLFWCFFTGSPVFFFIRILRMVLPCGFLLRGRIFLCRFCLIVLRLGLGCLLHRGFRHIVDAAVFLDDFLNLFHFGTGQHGHVTLYFNISFFQHVHQFFAGDIQLFCQFIDSFFAHSRTSRMRSFG